MVGAKIKEYLVQNGIKQSFVAEKVGITPSQMYEICTRGRTIDCVLYYKICKVLDVPLDRFLKEDDEDVQR